MANNIKNFSFGAVSLREKYKVKPLLLSKKLETYNHTITDLQSYTKSEDYSTGDAVITLVINDIKQMTFDNYYNSFGNQSHGIFIEPWTGNGRSINDYLPITGNAYMSDGSVVTDIEFLPDTQLGKSVVLISNLPKYYDKGSMIIKIIIPYLGLYSCFVVSAPSLIRLQYIGSDDILDSSESNKIQQLNSTELLNSMDASIDYSAYHVQVGYIRLKRVFLNYGDNAFMGLIYEYQN